MNALQYLGTTRHSPYAVQFRLEVSLPELELERGDIIADLFKYGGGEKVMGQVIKSKSGSRWLGLSATAELFERTQGGPLSGAYRRKSDKGEMCTAWDVQLGDALRGRLVRGLGGWSYVPDGPASHQWASQRTVETVFHAVRRACWPPARSAMRLVTKGVAGQYYVASAPMELATVRVRVGDVLLAMRDYDAEPPQVQGLCLPLALEDYGALRALYDALEDTERLPLEKVWKGNKKGGALRIIRTRQSWGLRREKWQTRLYLLRGVHPSPVRPIEASSDQHAIFELITQAGGRMPQES